MAELTDTYIGASSNPGNDSIFWGYQQGTPDADRALIYPHGDAPDTMGTGFFTPDPATTFYITVSTMEHGGADGMAVARVVNERYDRVTKMQFACNQLYANFNADGGYAGGPYGYGGNNDGNRIQYLLNPPLYRQRVLMPYGGPGLYSGGVWSEREWDPINNFIDDGHGVVLAFSGVTGIGDIQRTPNSRMASPSTGAISLTVDTPDSSDEVLDILIIGRSKLSFTMEPSNVEQEVLFVHETGDLYTGFGTTDYFAATGAGPYYQYYVSLRPRDGSTTEVGHDFVTGSGSNGATHVAIVLKNG